MNLNKIQFTLCQKPISLFILTIIVNIIVFVHSLPLLYTPVLLPQLDVDGKGSHHQICTLFVLLPCVTRPTLHIFELGVGHP